ncbi:MAG: hypothetical protein WA182_06835 [Candidatus Sulfotelmatobacter sp.]
MPAVYYLLIAAAFEATCSTLDSLITLRGIKSGLAIEANTWLVGTKPTADALFTRDALFLLFVCAPAGAVLALGGGHNPVFYGLLAAPVALGAKHIQAYFQWRTVLAGGKAPE